MNNKIKKSYDWIILKCNAPNVAYSQQYRNKRVINGIEYFDCSSLLYYALIEGGFALDESKWPFTTSIMKNELIKLGFQYYNVSSNFKWEEGDIGLTPGKHTEMCFKGGLKPLFMGARTSKGNIDKQVSISQKSRTFKLCFRYNNNAADYPDNNITENTLQSIIPIIIMH